MSDSRDREPPPRRDTQSFAELTQFEVHEESVRLLKYRYCLLHEVVVLGRVGPDADAPVLVGMLDPTASEIRAEVETFLGRPIEPIQLNSWEIRRALDIGYGRIQGPERWHREGFVLHLQPVDDLTLKTEQSIVEMIDEILGRAVFLGASDVHIESYEGDVDVRLRIDGVLEQVGTQLSRDNLAAVISRLKVAARLDLAEKRRSQDGRIQAIYEIDGRARPVDFRLSIVPGPTGEDAVLRILDSAKPILGLDQLGLPEPELQRFGSLIANPEGLLLVTGPTGSGKTTTLYSALARIAQPDKKILTAEDPIEYVLTKVNQKEISAQMTFADYARAFLRQDPDVLLIGEIRDEETADAALRAAQTGHLVLSTLHTIDAVRTVSRLTTLGIDRSLIAGSLLGALSQRLVRRLCAACREEAAPSDRQRRALGLREGDGPFYCAPGCPECSGTGYRGRVGIFELFAVDDEMADLIAAHTPIHELRRAALGDGMATLAWDALAKARAGLTSLDEILRVVPYRLLAEPGA